MSGLNPIKLRTLPSYNFDFEADNAD
jgi:hypothetical protein